MPSQSIHDRRQIDLENWLSGSYRHGDPSTSVKAAKKISVEVLNSRILKLLAMADFTTEEIARLIRRSLQSVTPRMAPLEKRGLVRRTDKTRMGRSGRERIVWALVKKDPGPPVILPGSDLSPASYAKPEPMPIT